MSRSYAPTRDKCKARLIMPEQTITLGQLIGDKEVEEFESFDLTEVQKVLKTLGNEQGFDLAHSEYLLQKSLYGADLLVDMLTKLVKTTSFLENRINVAKNRAALEYKPVDGKATADMRRNAGECSEEVERLGMQLAKARAAKISVEKKYELLLKTHYFHKELWMTQKGSIIAGTAKGVNGIMQEKIQNGATEWK